MASSPEDPGALNVKNLSYELSSVANWHQLGIKLGLQPAQLRQVEIQYPVDIERRKVEVSDLWLQGNPGASWKHIVIVLREMGDHTTAERIELKYVKGGRVRSHPDKSSKAAVFAYENQQTINVKFVDLLMNVRGKMLNMRVDIEEFLFFVRALFRPGDCIPSSPTNLSEVFEAITHHGLWDYFHYSPLVRIVEKFGAGDLEMKDWIKSYKKDLKAYTIVASIENCIESYLDTCTDQSREDRAKYDPHHNCPVEWKTDFVDHSLQHLANVWEMFSDRYLVPDSPPTALLDRVRNGCVCVTWLVPSYLIPQLVERVKTDTEFFQYVRILKVTVRGETVYEKTTSVSQN